MSCWEHETSLPLDTPQVRISRLHSRRRLFPSALPPLSASVVRTSVSFGPASFPLITDVGALWGQHEGGSMLEEWEGQREVHS